MDNEKKKNNNLVWLAIGIIVAILIIGFLTGKVNVVPKEPDNYLPTIKYNYDTSLNSAEGNITLVVGVEDKDGDKMNIQFFVRNSPTDEWVGVGNFDGYNGEYYITTDYTRESNEPVQTAHWKVQLTDFKGYVNKEYSFKYDEN